MGAQHVLATRDGNRSLETRAGMQSNLSTGYGWMDPHAIPPPGLGHMQRAGVLVTEHTLLQVDVVFTALRIISNNLVKMGDLRAYEEEFSPEGISYRRYLPTRPAILTDTFGGGGLGGRGGSIMQCTGRDRTIWSMALFGDAFWYVLDRDRLKYPSALEVLHPAFMEVKQAPNGMPVYLYGAGAGRRELDPDDVVHIPFKSLPGARRAMAPTEYVGVAGALAMAAYEFGSTWFSQGAAPSFLLTTDQKLGQEQIERIAERFLIEHSGLQAAHLPVVLDSGLKAEKVMASPDEAQYLHTLEYARNVIASWFGIPLSMLGNALERQTPPPPHTMQEESLKFLQHTLSGYTVPLEEAHSALLPDGQRAAFNDSALSRPDDQFLAQLILNLRQSQAASVNDIRTRYLEWAPVDGGDDVIAPLASNTAPEQTDGSDDERSDGADDPAPDSGSSEGRSLVPHISLPPIAVNVHPAEIRIDNHVEPTPIEVAAPQVEVRAGDVHVEPTPITVTPDIRVDVSPTPITVAAPHVDVAAPEVRVEGATINVEPTPVNVDVKAPRVHVDNHVDVPPAEVNVRIPPRNVKVLRDRRGRISGTEEE